MSQNNCYALPGVSCVKRLVEAYHLNQNDWVCALSGGADSVYLFYALLACTKEEGTTLSCLHVHHGIRGEAAEEDLQFCQRLCYDNGISLTIYRVDVPAYATEHRKSLETAAREMRYGCFAEHLEKNPNAVLFTAHHATDQAETVLFRLARGTGLKGLCGIPEHRDRFYRPLLSLTREQIRDQLHTAGIAYRRDESNEDPGYTRNKVRQTLLPLLEEVHLSAVSHIATTAQTLKEDEDFLQSQARALLAHAGDSSFRTLVRQAHPAIAKRAIVAMYDRVRTSPDALEHSRVEEILSYIRSAKRYVEIALAGDVTFYVDGGTLYCEKNDTPIPIRQDLELGVNTLEGRDAVLILSHSPISKDLYPSPNIYKLVTEKTFPSDRMNNGYYIRSKLDGDAYRFGGMTHKVKTMFADRKLTRRARRRLPILCDEDGILWIPGFDARDPRDGNKKMIYVCYFIKLEEYYD